MKIGRFFRHGNTNEGAKSVSRGMLTLALGSGAARLLSIAAIPVLSRIYAPEDYGVLSVFTGVTMLLAPLLTLRYVTALPLPRHPGLALSLLALCGILMLVNVTLIAMVLWLFGSFVLGFFSMEVLAHYWWLIVICLLGTAAYEAMTMWATRQRAYRHIAQTQFTQSFFGALTKVALGLMALKPMGLLIGQAVGVSAGVGSLVLRSRKEFKKNVKFVTWRNIARVAGGYRSFPLYRLPSQFLLVFSVQAPLLFTAALFDASTTGNLGMAITALTVPMSLIGTAVGQAFYGEIAKIGKNHPRKIYDISKSTQIRLFMLGIPVAATITVFGEGIFKIVLGAEWSDAGIYASSLAPYLMFQLTSAPLMNVLNVFNRQGIFLAINLFRAACLLLLFSLVSMLEMESFVFISAYSAVMTAFYSIISIYVMSVLWRKTKEKEAFEGERKKP